MVKGSYMFYRTSGVFLIGLMLIKCEKIPTPTTEKSSQVCGKASTLFEDCFKNNSASSSDSNSLPHTQQEISHRCSVFNQGIKCLHEYTDKCLDSQTKRLLENEVYGAKNFYRMLCMDQKFAKDYLKHQSCFQYILKDWERCSKDFQGIMKEELQKNQRNEMANLNVQYMHFCCARHAYEQCVFTAAKYKCKPESAIFTRQVAELLSSEHKFKNCDTFENHICSGAFKSFSISSIFSVLIVREILLKGLI